MNTIRVKIHINSDTLRMPELRPMIGKDVVITVREAIREKNGKQKETPKPHKTWFDTHFGAGWPDKKDDGFEDALRDWRQEDSPRELPE